MQPSREGLINSGSVIPAKAGIQKLYDFPGFRLGGPSALGRNGELIRDFPGKFPHSGVVINRYLHGETLFEAYWKSVAWSGEEIFIGEPLVVPFSHKSENNVNQIQQHLLNGYH